MDLIYIKLSMIIYVAGTSLAYALLSKLSILKLILMFDIVIAFYVRFCGPVTVVDSSWNR